MVDALIVTETEEVAPITIELTIQDPIPGAAYYVAESLGWGPSEHDSPSGGEIAAPERSESPIANGRGPK